MKRFLAIAIAATVGLAFASAAQAAIGAAEGTYGSAVVGAVSAYSAGMSANGIQASRHNLGSMGMSVTASPGVNATSTSEICVFCHTPHHTVKGDGGNTTGLTTWATTGGGGNNSSNDYSPAPLWNRRSAATSFTAYGTTIGGTNTSTIGGVTLACLSCHDGVTTFDNLVNAPGPDGLQDIYGDAGSAGWTFMDEGEAGQSGTLGGEARLNIGNSGGDLSNDHPMSIAYNGGTVASLRLTSTVIADINLAAGLFTTNTELKANLEQNRWAVKGFISSTATIADLLRVGNVECSSCHDPHFKNLSNIDLNNTTLVNAWDGVEVGTTGIGTYGSTSSGKKHDVSGFATSQNLITINKTGGTTATGVQNVKQDGLFLRRVGGNAGSGVCRTCHAK